MIEEMVKENLAKIIGQRDASVFYPFFTSRKLYYEIIRLQTVPEQRAWGSVFEKYGCIVCKRKDVSHVGCGCCDRCYKRILERKKAAIREIEEGLPQPPPIRDKTEIAMAALFGPPSRAALPAAPDKKRPAKIGHR
jgi:hypothetical protein